jgi:hypothetical protein
MSSSNGVAVKIKTYKISKRGIRGLVLSLPGVWVKDNFLAPGDVLDVFRTDDNRLIIQRADRVAAVVEGA